MAKKYTIERNLVLNQVKEGGTEDRVIVIDENNEVSSVPRSEFGAQDLQSVLDNGNVSELGINLNASGWSAGYYSDGVSITSPSGNESTFFAGINQGDGGIICKTGATGGVNRFTLNDKENSETTDYRFDPNKGMGSYTIATTDDVDLKADLDSPTFTGSVQVPDATLPTEAVNKGQLNAAISSSPITIVNTNSLFSTGIDAGVGATNAAQSNFLGVSAGYAAINAADSNFIGSGAGDGAANASYSNFLGYRAGKAFGSNNVGSNNIIIGTNISLPDASENSINLGGVVFGFNTNAEKFGEPKIVATADGRVAIGSNADDGMNRLQVNGNVKADGFVKEGGTSTEFLMADGSVSTGVGGGAWGDITGTLSDQIDLQSALDLKANVASPTFTGTVSGIDKTMVGLGNVDNTSDLDKPISTATQTALNAKENAEGYLTIVSSATPVTLTDSSPRLIMVTGTVAQTINLPVVSTLTLGHKFIIVNLMASQNVNVKSSGGNAFGYAIHAGLSNELICISTTGTTTASWTQLQMGSINRTGNGSWVVHSIAPVLSIPSYTVNANFTAGTNAQGQGTMTTDVIRIATTGANPSGVTLMSANFASKFITVVNNGTNPVNIYPLLGESIDGLAANVPIQIPVGGVIRFNSVTSTSWRSDNVVNGANQSALNLKANLSGGNTLNGDQTITGAATITGLATLGSGSGNHFSLAGSATNPILSTIGSSANVDMLLRPKGNGQVVVGAGSWAYATGPSGAGSILLNNGTTDSPNLKFAYGNNQNFAMDVSGSTLRFIVNSDEAIGATAIGNINTLGQLTMNGGLRGSSLGVNALNTAPASATATGTTGEIRITSTHIFVCIATNTWVRSALTTW